MLDRLRGKAAFCDAVCKRRRRCSCAVHPRRSVTVPWGLSERVVLVLPATLELSVVNGDRLSPFDFFDLFQF